MIDEDAFGVLSRTSKSRMTNTVLTIGVCSSSASRLSNAPCSHLLAGMELPGDYHVVCFGHAVYVELRDGEHGPELFAQVRRASALLARANFVNVTVLSHGGRWVSDGEPPGAVDLRRPRAHRAHFPSERAAAPRAGCGYDVAPGRRRARLGSGRLRGHRRARRPRQSAKKCSHRAARLRRSVLSRSAHSIGASMTDAQPTPTLCLADDELFDQHLSPPGHPERPARLIAARQGVQDSALGKAARRLPGRDASHAEIALVHEPGYVESLAETSGQNGHLDADTFYSPRSFDAARRATGAALAMTDALLDGTSDFGFALMRPPGHHARPGQSMGFCMINHVAVAARHALGHGARRVVILDWDVHHGNGTEEISSRRPRCSTCPCIRARNIPAPALPATSAPDGTGLYRQRAALGGRRQCRVRRRVRARRAADHRTVCSGPHAGQRWLRRPPSPRPARRHAARRARLCVDDEQPARYGAARSRAAHRLPARGRLPISKASASLSSTRWVRWSSLLYPSKSEVAAPLEAELAASEREQRQFWRLA